MRKQVRLLIENVFDDLYDIDQENNLSIDIADEHLNMYNIGDIYYDKKKPYAICCGLKSDFQDNQPRFILIKKDFKDKRWCIYQDKRYGIYEEGDYNRSLMKLLGLHTLDNFYLKSQNDFKQIDEKGHENTQKIYNKYYMEEFPACWFCCRDGYQVYLPAIDELQKLYLNKDKINEKLKTISGAKYLDFIDCYYSSSLKTFENAWGIDFSDGEACGIYKRYQYRVRPFFKLKN